MALILRRKKIPVTMEKGLLGASFLRASCRRASFVVDSVLDRDVAILRNDATLRATVWYRH